MVHGFIYEGLNKNINKQVTFSDPQSDITAFSMPQLDFNM